MSDLKPKPRQPTLQEKKDRLEELLLMKNAAVFQLDSIRFQALSGDEYKVIRSALEGMASVVERELYNVNKRIDRTKKHKKWVKKQKKNIFFDYK